MQMAKYPAAQSFLDQERKLTYQKVGTAAEGAGRQWAMA